MKYLIHKHGKCIGYFLTEKQVPNRMVSLAWLKKLYPVKMISEGHHGKDFVTTTKSL